MIKNWRIRLGLILFVASGALALATDKGGWVIVGIAAWLYLAYLEARMRFR